MTHKPEPSAFEKFGRMLGKILRVPKEEIAEDRDGARKEESVEGKES